MEYRKITMEKTELGKNSSLRVSAVMMGVSGEAGKTADHSV